MGQCWTRKDSWKLTGLVSPVISTRILPSAIIIITIIIPIPRLISIIMATLPLLINHSVLNFIRIFISFKTLQDPHFSAHRKVMGVPARVDPDRLGPTVEPMLPQGIGDCFCVLMMINYELLLIDFSF